MSPLSSLAGYSPRDDQFSARYRSSPVVVSVVAFAGTISVLIGVTVFAIPLMLRPWWVQVIGMWLLTVPGLCFLLAGVTNILRALCHFGLDIAVFSHGFHFSRRGRKAFIPWNAIASVWISGRTMLQDTKMDRFYVILKQAFGSRHCTVVTHDGRMFAVACLFSGFMDYVNVVEREVTRRLLPLALAAYQDGQELTFGPVSVGFRGWSRGSFTIPWCEVKAIMVADGWFVVTSSSLPQRLWIGLPISKIPNYSVLLSFLNEMKVPLLSP
jgi:hypothetical protein